MEREKNKEKPFSVFSSLDENEDPEVTQAGKITRSSAAAGMPNMVNCKLRTLQQLYVWFFSLICCHSQLFDLVSILSCLIKSMVRQKLS